MTRGQEEKRAEEGQSSGDDEGGDGSFRNAQLMFVWVPVVVMVMVVITRIGKRPGRDINKKSQSVSQSATKQLLRPNRHTEVLLPKNRYRCIVQLGSGALAAASAADQYSPPVLTSMLMMMMMTKGMTRPLNHNGSEIW